MKLNFVREAVMDDFSQIYPELESLSDSKIDENHLEEIFSDYVNDPDSLFLVSTSKGEINGFISCTIQHSLRYGGNIAEIQEMYAFGEDQRRAIGRKLIVAIQNFLKDRKVIQVEIKIQDSEQRELFNELGYNQEIVKQVNRLRKI